MNEQQQNMNFKKRIKHSLYVLPLYLCVLLLISSSIGCSQKNKTMPVSEESIEVPFQEFSNSTLYFYNNEYIQWKLQSKQMRKPITDTGITLVVPVRLTLFDSLGVVQTLVIADSGNIRSGMDSYNIWGDVYIRTRDSMIIRSQQLNWYKDRHKVESNTYVQIETKNGDILRGKGLDAVEDFSHFSFKSNVTGKFPNFKRRVESNEEDVF